MQYFFCKLIPPRPTFAQDMTDVEAEIMAKHVAYWKDFAEKGTAIVFGPVADPHGAWGLGVLEVEDEEDMRNLTSNDPAILGAIGLEYEILPMLTAITRT